MVEENLENYLSQTPQNGQFYYVMTISMIEENFDIWLYETSQNVSIQNSVSRYEC